jgi:hypothetical protein
MSLAENLILCYCKVYEMIWVWPGRCTLWTMYLVVFATSSLIQVFASLSSLDLETKLLVQEWQMVEWSAFKEVSYILML